MGITDKAWEAFRDVLRLQDRVILLSEQLKNQQSKIEKLSIEMAQLQFVVRYLMMNQGVKELPRLPGVEDDKGMF